MHENLFFLNYTPFFKLAMHTSMDKLAKNGNGEHYIYLQFRKGEVK